MAAVKIDPDVVAALGNDMLSTSQALALSPTSVGASTVASTLGRAAEGSSLEGSYAATTQGVTDAVEALSGALATNAEYVLYAAQQGDVAFN